MPQNLSRLPSILRLFSQYVNAAGAKNLQKKVKHVMSDVIIFIDILLPNSSPADGLPAV